MTNSHTNNHPLEVKALSVSYQGKMVLWDINYTSPSSALICVVGPNGAGKSTFIKACLGLVPSNAGYVNFWGQTYSLQCHRVGYVPQREVVDWDFPVSVLDVVCMGVYRKIGWCRRVRNEHKKMALDALEKVDMAEFSSRHISQLSGGQQQRVFLARALVQNAELYFMDEPFTGVDAATEQAIVLVLRELREKGCTVICVHHDLSSISKYFDYVVMLNTRLIAAGKTSKVFNNKNLAKTYGGRLTLLDEVSQEMARVMY